MGYFIEYQIFSSVEEVEALKNLLDVNEIPFKVGNNSIRFYLNETSIDSSEDGIVIETKVEETKRVDKINQRNSELSFVNYHYMYLMPDNFIVEAVVNPLEWTDEEHILAKEILKLRKIKQPQK